MTLEVTVEQCLTVFDQVVRAGALIDLGALESALAQPFSGLGDQEYYPTLYEKAARLGYGVCKAHAFQDGNKRIAWLMTVIFLDINGVQLNVEEDEAAHVVLALADNRCSYIEFLEWLTACVLPSGVTEAVPIS
jgi:death-on-curing family protein